ncbi:MAG: EamA family transporter [Polyangiaceae bacterium]|nr:EamA family transporter [Polyangiaceae bacterium]
MEGTQFELIADARASALSSFLRGARALFSRLDRRLVLAVAAIWLLWGSTYLAMRVAVAEMPPFGLAGARFVVAGLVVLGYAKVRGEPWPRWRTWLVAIPAGMLLFLGGNGFIVMAEEKLPSSIAAVICATTPLIVALLSALRGDKPHRGEIAGMGLGMLGVAALGWGSSLSGAGIRGLLLVLSPVTFAVGSLLVQTEGSDAGFASSGAQMLAGGLSTLGVSALRGEHFPVHVSPSAIFAWLWLVVFGSVVGFCAYVWLLRNQRTSLAMSHAYVNPVVAVLLGALFAGEPLGFGTVCATALIAAGVMCAALLRPRNVSNSGAEDALRDPRNQLDNSEVALALMCGRDVDGENEWRSVPKSRNHFNENEHDDDDLQKLRARSLDVRFEKLVDARY